MHIAIALCTSPGEQPARGAVVCSLAQSLPEAHRTLEIRQLADEQMTVTAVLVRHIVGRSSGFLMVAEGKWENEMAS